MSNDQWRPNNAPHSGNGRPGPAPSAQQQAGPAHPGQASQRPQQPYGQQPQAPQAPQHQYGQQPQGPQGPQHQYAQQGQPQMQNPYAQQGPHNAFPQGQQPYPQQGVQVQEKRRSKTPAIIASVLALVLVVGGGFTAWWFLKGSPSNGVAAQGLPSNSVVAFEVNLNPSAGDKLAVKDLVEKFPALRDKAGDAEGNYKKALYEAIPEDDMPPWSEVEPWLGDSVAVGAVMHKGVPSPVISIQVTDQDKARDFWAKHAPEVKVEFSDDLAVIAEPDLSIDVAGLKDNSITTNDTYKRDTGKLGDGYLASAWVSEEFYRWMIRNEMGQEADNLPVGHGAAGLTIEDGALLVRSFSTSTGDPQVGTGAADFGKDLPAGWVFASLPLTDDMHQQLFETAQKMLGDGLRDFGINSAEDLKKVIGSKVAVSVDNDEQRPSVVVKVETEDPQAHQDFVDKLMGSSVSVPVERKVDGNVVWTVMGSSVEEATNAASKASEHPHYGQVVKGGDAAIAFVDIATVMDRLPADMPQEMVENLKPLSAVGMTSKDGGEGYTHSEIRVGTR